MKSIIVIATFLVLASSCGAEEPDKMDIELLVEKGSRPSYFVGKFGQVSVAVDSASGKDARNVAVIKMDDLDGDSPTINYAEVYLYGNECSPEPNTIIQYGTRFPGGYALPQAFSTFNEGCMKINFYHAESGVSGKVVDTFFIRLKFTSE